MFLVKRSRLLVLEITILFIKCTKNNMCHLPHLYIIEVCGYFKRYLTPYIASVSLLVTVFFHAILLTNLIILVTRNKLVFVRLLTYFASKITVSPHVRLYSVYMHDFISFKSRIKNMKYILSCFVISLLHKNFKNKF